MHTRVAFSGNLSMLALLDALHDGTITPGY